MVEARRIVAGWMLALLAMVSAALIASPVRAQDPLIGDDNIRAELHADGTPESGETWTLAFHFIPNVKSVAGRGCGVQSGAN